MATRMTGGEAMVAALQTHGVTTLFGLPGVQLELIEVPVGTMPDPWALLEPSPTDG